MFSPLRIAYCTGRVIGAQQLCSAYLPYSAESKLQSICQLAVPF
jgi:hypothetical protein